MKLRIFLSLLFLSFLFNSKINAEDTYTAIGVVWDKEDNSPIPGATIKVIGINKGTYSSSRGKFRIPFLKGKHQLKIMSLGYETKIVEIDKDSDTLLISLYSSPALLKGATVIGNIEPNEIIKRAIEKKNDNISKLKTFRGLLYSKLIMELDGSMFAGAGDNSFSISATMGDKPPEEYKMFVLETFSNNYEDYEKNLSFTEIIQRRQTANIVPDANIFALSGFFNLYKDDLKFLNANFVTPLSNDAFDYYNYELIEKSILDDRYIYVIRVTPNSKLYPLFTGYIKIVEGTYNLVEFDLEPSKTSPVAFLDSIRIIQKFEEIEDDIWHPAFLEVSAKARVELIKGLMDVSVLAKANSIYSQMQVNKPLPDSIYHPGIRKLTVATLADSSDIEYWEKNSLREISEKEKQIYLKVDSLVTKSDSIKKEISAFNYNLYEPYIDFNRAGSLTLGLSPTIYYNNFSLRSNASWSFGLKQPLGSAVLSYSTGSVNNSLKFRAKLFSNIGTTGYDNSYPRIVNTLTAAILHEDYYDYFKEDGWGLGLKYTNNYFSIETDFDNNRASSIGKNTDRSIFVTKTWRENPEIDKGNYYLSDNSISLLVDKWMPNITGFNMNIFVNYLYGVDLRDNSPFDRMYGNLSMDIPTIYTGYNPLKLSILLEYGIGSNLPSQYYHKAKTSISFISRFGNFYTMPYSIYESEGYYAGFFKYNFTDIWWRWLGLPVYEGRGLDLVFNASTGKFKTAFNSKHLYSEAGFGLERIPTFFSNVIYLGAGAVWGAGPIAKGKFQWYLDITLPF